MKLLLKISATTAAVAASFSVASPLALRGATVTVSVENDFFSP